MREPLDAIGEDKCKAAAEAVIGSGLTVVGRPAIRDAAIDEAIYADVMQAIKEERAFQDKKYGRRQHQVGAWLMVMRAELLEAEQAWAKGSDNNDALCEILQVVAVGVACMEHHGAIRRR